MRKIDGGFDWFSIQTTEVRINPDPAFAFETSHKGEGWKESQGGYTVIGASWTAIIPQSFRLIDVHDGSAISVRELILCVSYLSLRQPKK